MTKETKTDLIHEYMYDQLNDSNNSNDGRDVKHVQERPQKNGKKNPVTRKTKEDRSTTKKGTKITVVVNAKHQTGQDSMNVPPNPLNAETVKREDIYEKMCRIPKRIHHKDETTSSAE